MKTLAAAITAQVSQALDEDLGSGDITAQLLPQGQTTTASIVCRDTAVLCGQAWVKEVFHQVDPTVQIEWRIAEGEAISGQTTDRCVAKLTGSVVSLLAGERSALNFLQTLSAVASITQRYVQAVAGTKARILDTRKTLPGWRLAQKYAVRCGGGSNHRQGLFDAILIKENHIAAAGDLIQLVTAAKNQHPDKLVVVEVETLVELTQALSTAADRILLDNFTLEQLVLAVKQSQGRALEVSGGVSLATVRAIAETGVDYISVGALTKHIQAIDFSMLF